MLQLKNLTFSYRRKKSPILRNISLDIREGGIYGLLGLNGAGKTTLMNLVCGLLTPDSGTVMFNGSDTRKRLPSTMSDIFFVPEEIDLPKISVNDFVKAYSGFYPRFSASDFTHHLCSFGLTPSINLGGLSMGQRKKAFLSFAMACNTRLLVMDEPTNGLDIPGKSAFRSLVAGEMNDERTVIISSHQVRDIDQILDHLIILSDSGILLDESIFSITSLLKFAVTTSPSIVSEAYYSQPVFQGNIVILPNDGEDDSDINVETLFDFAINNPELIRKIFDRQ